NPGTSPPPAAAPPARSSAPPAPPPPPPAPRLAPLRTAAAIGPPNTHPAPGVPRPPATTPPDGPPPAVGAAARTPGRTRESSAAARSGCSSRRSSCESQPFPERPLGRQTGGHEQEQVRTVPQPVFDDRRSFGFPCRKQTRQPPALRDWHDHPGVAREP